MELLEFQMADIGTAMKMKALNVFFFACFALHTTTETNKINIFLIQTIKFAEWPNRNEHF